ncbi:MAG TPA: hypothetical protein VGO59_00940 [Verrucomicrobiae bacterium]|jgi:hypothetical protein
MFKSKAKAILSSSSVQLARCGDEFNRLEHDKTGRTPPSFRRMELFAKVVFITITIQVFAEMASQKTRRFCRKTGVANKQNECFRNGFSIFHEFSPRKAFSRNNMR